MTNRGRKPKDYTGLVAGKLTAIAYKFSHKGRAHWLSRCECGREIVCAIDHVQRGRRKSCGECGDRVKTNKSRAIQEYGRYGKKLYNTYKRMVRRCYCEADLSYKNYGGRGIKVCKDWLDSFDRFVVDIGEPPTPSHSIDRIDVNGDYCKANCRWATLLQQQRNKRDTRLYYAFGKHQTLGEWSEELGIPVRILRSRTNDKGMLLLEIIDFQTQGIPTLLSIFPLDNKEGTVFMSLKQWAHFSGLKVSTFLTYFELHGVKPIADVLKFYRVYEATLKRIECEYYSHEM